MPYIAIVGKPGTGKTTGVKYLNPDQTLYVNADGKDLTWKGAKQQYNAERKNHYKISSFEKIQKAFEYANKTPEIKNFIFDTANAVMNDIEMKQNSIGFKGWLDLAQNMYELLKPNQEICREDLFVFVLFHEGTDDQNVRRIVSNGRKLEKINLEGLFNNVFFTKVEFQDNKPEYKLIVEYDGGSASKSVDGLFDTSEIPNNYQMIVDAIKKWENG